MYVISWIGGFDHLMESFMDSDYSEKNIKNVDKQLEDLYANIIKNNQLKY